MKKKKFQVNPPFSKKNFFLLLNNWSFFFLILFLPTQLGKHFFFPQSFIFGIRVDYLAPTIYFFDILTFILFFLNFNYLLKFFIQKKIIFLILFLIINSTFSLFPLISFLKILRILQWLGIFFILKKNLSLEKKPPQKIKNLITTALFLGTLFEFLLALGQFISKKSLGGIFWFFGERAFSLSTPEIAKVNFFGYEALRSYGTFSHPNSLAGFYLLVYFYYLTANDKKGYHWRRFFFLLLSSFLILLSFSKLALTLWFLGSLFYFYKYLNCHLCFFARLLTLTTVFFVFIFSSSDQHSWQNRLLLLKENQAIFQIKWLQGAGLGAYIKGKEFIKPIAFPYYLITQPVHNVFLLIITEMGLVVFLIFFLFFLKWIKRLWQKNRLVLLVFLITSFFDHYWWTLPQNFFLLPLISALILF